MPAEPQIAFLCHPYHRGGVTRWMADAAVEAARRGCTVYFVVPRPGKPFVSAGGREPMLQLLAPHSGLIKIISVDVGWEFEFGTHAYRMYVYRQLVLQHVPAGAWLIPSDDKAVWDAAGTLAHQYPMIGVLHGDQDYYYERALDHKDALSLMVCVSNRISRKLAERLNANDRKRTVTIPCGIKLPQILPAVRHAKLQLAFVGRLTDYEKRAYDLPPICGALARKALPYHLHIAGNSDTSAKEFATQFAQNGGAEHITFHGWVSAGQVEQILHGTDVLLLTSNSEGMPLVMMEALACGSGFVGTRVSGIEDFGEHAEAANCFRIYEIGDVAQAAAAIAELAAVPPEERSASARKMAEQEFSLTVCIDRYMDAIKQMPPKTVPAPANPPKPAIWKEYLHALPRYLSVRLKK